jgi:hypothetical protein
VIRDEALAEIARLEKEDPQRETHEFLPRENEDGSWDVVRLPLPPGVRKAKGEGTTVEPAPERPHPAPDTTERSRPYWA